MTKSRSCAIVFIVLILSVSSLANPGALWGLGQKGLWGQVDEWLEHDPDANISWKPAGEANSLFDFIVDAQEAIRNECPRLYRRFFGAEEVARSENVADLLEIPQAQLLFDAGLSGGAFVAPPPRAAPAPNIHKRVRDGDTRGVMAALDADPELLDLVDENHHTPLYCAYHAGQVETIAYLEGRRNAGDHLQWEVGGVHPGQQGHALRPFKRLIQAIINNAAVMLETPDRDIFGGTILLEELLNTLTRTPGLYLRPALEGLRERAAAILEQFENEERPVLADAIYLDQINQLQALGVRVELCNLVRQVIRQEYNVKGIGVGATLHLLPLRIGGDVGCGILTSPMGAVSCYGSYIARAFCDPLLILIPGAKIQAGFWRGTGDLRNKPWQTVGEDTCCWPFRQWTCILSTENIRVEPELEINNLSAGHLIELGKFKVGIKKGFRIWPRRNFKVVYRRLGINLNGMFDPAIFAALMANAAPVRADVVVPENAEINAQECAVCLEAIAGRAVRLTCLHAYCKACARGWFGEQQKKTCPTCRAEQPNDVIMNGLR